MTKPQRKPYNRKDNNSKQYEKNSMQTFCGITTDGMLDYLAAIYKLGGQRTRVTDKVTTSALAEKMHVSPAAVSSMLKRLEESSFVDRSNADGITLTEQGELAALQLVRRHRLLEVFLIKVMGFTWDQVDVEAHRLEHSISAAFEDRMDRLCGYPTHCPHGDPIPRKDGAMKLEPLMPVTQLAPGQGGILRRVGSSDARVLRYLAQLRLEPGCTVKLVDAAPFNGPVTLELRKGNGDHVSSLTQMLGSELAGQLFVVVEQGMEQRVENGA
ncbi:MAG TPA: metal-dependent transcriptional regulator [Rhodocyclaceae bacterium]|nr:metal-dependent transcriptional regulator [Rhodocyclaceae bacterium]